MSVKAGELLDIMSARLGIQEKVVTDPSVSVKDATKSLVMKLSKIDASENIRIIIEEGNLAKYIRASNGEVLAEIDE